MMIMINKNISIRSLLRTDLHMHTTWCDGKSTPEEMVLSAIDKGFECIGFSGHSFVSFDLECGMTPERAAAYRQDIKQLKEKYRNDISIFCGIEQDYYSEQSTSEYDYVIGSVHYINTPDVPLSVDDTPEIFCDGVRKYFKNDFYLAAEAYFEAVSEIVDRTNADIIGHFDLISKFNEKEHLFDENHQRYINAWKKAADKLIPTGKPFEINTGAISRAWRTVPYPSPDMIGYIREHGGHFILSSDSHTKETIGYGFNKAAELL